MMLFHTFLRYGLTYPMVTWWGILVTLKLLLWPARPLMMLSRYFMMLLSSMYLGMESFDNMCSIYYAGLNLYSKWGAYFNVLSTSAFSLSCKNLAITDSVFPWYICRWYLMQWSKWVEFILSQQIMEMQKTWWRETRKESLLLTSLAMFRYLPLTLFNL